MDPYRIALLGYGTVGKEVLRLLSTSRKQCEQRAGRPLDVVAVAIRDDSRTRSTPPGCQPRFTTDAASLCEADDVDLIVELVGGVELPRTLIEKALRSGKDVVTANKAVLAEHGDALFEVARECGQQLLFEASVAGAIPILQALQIGLPASRIDTLTGILNGTCNHLLASMQRGVPFDVAVQHAQEQGFAEADPTLDVDGTDAAHKLALLTRILTGKSVPLAAVRCEGIVGITPDDLAFGDQHGWTLKLLAEYRATATGATLGVCPTWIPSDSVLAAVRDEYNAVLLEGEPFGSMAFQGKGAGGGPTAGSVVADVLRAGRGEGRVPDLAGTLEVDDPLAVEARYYLRFVVADRPGVLGRIATVLGDRGVSLVSVEQPEVARGAPARIHAVTHRVVATDVDQAFDTLVAEGVVRERPIRVRLHGIAQEMTPTDTNEAAS